MSGNLGATIPFADYGPPETGSVGLTATGSTQGGAYLLLSRINEFSTVPSGSGCILPTQALPTVEIVVINRGANALNVYPASGGQIESNGTNTASVVAVSGAMTFVCFDESPNNKQWYIKDSTVANSAFTVGGLLTAGSAVVSGSLGVAGALSLETPITQTGTAYTVAPTDCNLILNPTGAMTITLPTASTSGGLLLNLKLIAAHAVTSASSNVVPLAGGAAGSAVLSGTAGKYCTLISDGTNWQIMAAN